MSVVCLWQQMTHGMARGEGSDSWADVNSLLGLLRSMSKLTSHVP